jgi:hypothetical protein
VVFVLDQEKGYHHKDLINLLLQGETIDFISPPNENEKTNNKSSKLRKNTNATKQQLMR